MVYDADTQLYYDYEGSTDLKEIPANYIVDFSTLPEEDPLWYSRLVTDCIN